MPAGKKKIRDDVDSPELTEAWFAKAKRAADVVPEVVKNPPRLGRPRVQKPMIVVSLRLSPDTVGAYKRRGRGWQMLMRAAIDAAAPKPAKTKSKRR